MNERAYSSTWDRFGFELMDLSWNISKTIKAWFESNNVNPNIEWIPYCKKCNMFIDNGELYDNCTGCKNTIRECKFKYTYVFHKCSFCNKRIFNINDTCCIANHLARENGYGKAVLKQVKMVIER
jgi:hypothetical protein